MKIKALTIVAIVVAFIAVSAAAYADAPAQKVGSFIRAQGVRTIAWDEPKSTDGSGSPLNVAAYRISGSVEWRSCTTSGQGFEKEESSFDETLAPTARSYSLPTAVDPRNTILKAYTVRVAALDGSGNELLTDGISFNNEGALCPAGAPALGMHSASSHDASQIIALASASVCLLSGVRLFVGAPRS